MHGIRDIHHAVLKTIWDHVVVVLNDYVLLNFDQEKNNNDMSNVSSNNYFVI